MINYNDTTNNCNDHTKWNDNYDGQNCHRIIVMTNYCVRIIIVSFYESEGVWQTGTKYNHCQNKKKMIGTLLMIKVFLSLYFTVP